MNTRSPQPRSFAATFAAIVTESHAQHLRDDTAPQTREVFEEIARFFDKHMAK